MIDHDQRGRVAVLTINRPDARNAVNGDVASGLEAAIDRLEEDPDTWVAVLTGAGTVFSAGADLKAIATGQAAALNTDRGGFAGIARRERTKPIIAAVNGPALAGGCEIVLSCDLVVASSEARFGIPEVKRSLVAGAGGLFRLPRTLPRAIAMELALTGDPIDAERAYELGFINEIVEPDQVVDAAVALAERICANAPVAVRESRKVILEATLADDATAWRLTNEAFARVVQTEDFAEGPRAFIEKRPPEWKGR
ncbi:MAG: crotonase/enoyl-CoA hydratase family protein [Acidimicrobiales bacterium]